MIRLPNFYLHNINNSRRVGFSYILMQNSYMLHFWTCGIQKVDLSSLLLINLTAAATRGGDPRLSGLFTISNLVFWLKPEGKCDSRNGEETQNQPAYGEEILLFGANEY